MKIIVIADVNMQKEFESKGVGEGTALHFETSVDNAATDGDAYFYLFDEQELQKDIEWLKQIEKPVFINAVVTTLSQLPKNAIRINAWPGFLQRSIQEISASQENEQAAKQVLESLQWSYHLVPDVEGMIAPKVIAMIINEAFFALGDDVSTKEDIDIAMRLGTNYPYGPFEWCDKIGIQNIYNLLISLSKTNKRYEPAPSLTQHISS